MTVAPFTLGSYTEFAGGHGRLAVVVDGVPQQLFYLPDRMQHFVRSTPGQPFQIMIDITYDDDVELLVFDGAASYADAKHLLARGIPGVIFTGRGHYVVERMVGMSKLTPLVFGPRSGIIAVKLFNERREPTRVTSGFERGWELGEKLIQYGEQLPRS